MNILVAIALLCISNATLAGVFDPPQNDYSVSMLSFIFGQLPGISLFSQAQPDLVLSAMFEKFNLGLITIATLVVSYVALLSTVNTAQEGTAMGKKWSSVWTPIRSVLGISLLVPGPGSGYSLVQSTTMWLILQGSGFASEIWNIQLTTENVNTTEDQNNDESFFKQKLESSALIENLYRVALCYNVLRVADDIDIDTVEGTSCYKTLYFGVNNHKDLCGTLKVSFNITPEDYITNAETAKRECIHAANLKTEMYLDIISRFKSGLAKEASLTTKTPIRTKNITLPENNEAFVFDGQELSQEHNIEQHTDNIIGTLRTLKAPSNIDNSRVNNKNSQIANILSQGGWVTAGALYLITAENQATATSNSSSKLYKAVKKMDQFTTKPFSCSDACASEIYKDPQKVYDDIHKTQSSNFISFNDSGKASYDDIKHLFKYLGKKTSGEPLIKDLKSLLGIAQSRFLYNKALILKAPSPENIAEVNNVAESTSSKASFGDGNEDTGEFTSKLTDSFSKLDSEIDQGFAGLTQKNSVSNGSAFIQMTSNYSAVKSIISNSPHPLISMGRFGDNLMVNVEIIWGVVTGISLLIAAVMGICSAQLPTTLLYFTLLVLMVLPLLLGYAMSFWMFGAILTYFVPMIPLMFFTLGVLGWLGLVIEAMVAAPIVALGFVSPSNDELGKVAQALPIILGVVLRPSLMLFGLFVAGKVFTLMVIPLNSIFNLQFDVIGNSSMFKRVLQIGVYVGFVVALVNKCYALIYEVPNKVMRWVGGPQDHTDTSALQESKQQLQESGKAGQETMSGVSSGATRAANTTTQAEIKAQQKSKSNDKDGGSSGGAI